MRILILLLGFSAGAYLMLRLTMEMPVPPRACLADASCVVGELMATPSPAPRPGLRVEVYDPALEPWPSGEIHEPARLVTPLAEDVRPIALPRVEIVPLGRPDAHGVCAAVNGKRLHCVALFDPAFDERGARPG